MSPKSFLRRPKRKRKTSRYVLLIPVFGIIMVLAIAFLIGYQLFHGSVILSPLPGQLGKILPAATTPSDKEVLDLLQKQHIVYTAVSQSGEAYHITLNEKQQVILSRKKDLTEQISSLQIMLSRLTMEGREFRTLDLRYNKPVVSY